jgi:hypothetical protein
LNNNWSNEIAMRRRMTSEQQTAPEPAGAALVEQTELERMVQVAFEDRDAIAEIYKAVKEWMGPTEVGEVSHRLNKGESLWHELTRATLSAKIQRQQWEIENATAFGAMRLDATEQLTSERAMQTKAKPITEKDVDAKCYALYPDAFKRQELERERVLRAVDLLVAMLDQVASRIKTLQVMMGRGR